MSNLKKRSAPPLFSAPVSQQPPAAPTEAKAEPPAKVVESGSPAPQEEAAPEIDIRDIAPRQRRARAKPRPSSPAQPVVAGIQSATVIRLTEEQWAWVDAQSAAAKRPKWQVVLESVANHVAGLDDYFAVLIPEGGSVFFYRSSPEDVEGKKIERSIRLPPRDRGVLDGLVERSGAKSMSMYLRVAVYMEMGEQPGSGGGTGGTQPQHKRSPRKTARARPTAAAPG